MSHIETASTCWTEIEQNVADMLPQLDSFQVFCGVTSPEAAEQYIHFEQLPEPADGEVYSISEQILYNAFAIISSAPNFSYGRVQLQDGDYNHYGAVHVWFGRLVDNTALLHELDAIQRTMKNLLGAIPGEMITYLYDHGGVPVRQFLFNGPSVTTRNYEEAALSQIRAEMRIIWQSY